MTSHTAAAAALVPLPIPSDDPDPLLPPTSPIAERSHPLPPWARQQRHQTQRRGPLGREASTASSETVVSSNGGARYAASIASLRSTLAPREPMGVEEDNGFKQLWATAIWATRRSLQLFWMLSPLQRILALLAVAAVLVLGVLALVYSHAVFAVLGPIAAGWRALPFGLGYLLVFLVICATAFPPMVGYSTAVTLAGFVYGFPGGWPIAALGSVLGSLAAFWVSRTVAVHWVESLVGRDHRFRALAQVLKRDGVGVLALVRFCPLPFSLSNGFLATVRSVHPGTFAAATALASPKLLVHVFIGSRLALLAEEGDKMSTRDRIVNLTSMAIGGAVGLAVGWLIYRRTMRRAAEIAAEDALEAGLAIDGAAHSADGDDEGYADWDDETSQRRPLMVDPDAAALALDDDDGLALWGTDSNGQVGGYMDNFDAGDGDVNDGGAKRGTMNGKKSNGTV